MKRISVLMVGLTSQIILAANPPSMSVPWSLLINAQEPVQQFVTSDNATPIGAATDTTPLGRAGYGPPASSLVPEEAPNNVVLPAPPSSTALGSVNEQPSETPLATGLDIPSFIQCKRITMGMCHRSKDLPEFQDCFKRVKIPACKQFFAFAKMVGMAPGDDIDLVKHYQKGELDLIHLIRFGANYPGVYYTLGKNGNFVDMIFGPQTQKWDIRKDMRYPEIAKKFPDVALFSIVDKLPEVQETPDGTGLRLILCFQLLNGCQACELAGYAYVAYDFSDEGLLQDTTILSLEPMQ